MLILKNFKFLKSNLHVDVTLVWGKRSQLKSLNFLTWLLAGLNHWNFSLKITDGVFKCVLHLYKTWLWIHYWRQSVLSCNAIWWDFYLSSSAKWCRIMLLRVKTTSPGSRGKIILKTTENSKRLDRELPLYCNVYFTLSSMFMFLTFIDWLDFYAVKIGHKCQCSNTISKNFVTINRTSHYFVVLHKFTGWYRKEGTENRALFRSMNFYLTFHGDIFLNTLRLPFLTAEIFTQIEVFAEIIRNGTHNLSLLTAIYHIGFTNDDMRSHDILLKVLLCIPDTFPALKKEHTESFSVSDWIKVSQISVTGNAWMSH